MKQIFSSIVSTFIIGIYLLVHNSGNNEMDLQKHPSIVQAVKLQDTVTLSGTWLLQPVLASDTANSKIPSIHFNLTKHTFTGFTGCNNFSGSFTYDAKTLQINEQIVLTKMQCDGYNEKAFLANLLRVNGYQIKDGVLELLIDKTPISKWVRKLNNKLVAKA